MILGQMNTELQIDQRQRIFQQKPAKFKKEKVKVKNERESEEAVDGGKLVK